MSFSTPAEFDDTPQGQIRRMVQMYSRPKPQPAPEAPPAVGASIATPDAPPPVVVPKAPSAPQQRIDAANAELNGPLSRGSGVDQYAHKHPILGTIAKIGDAVGSALFPTIAMQVPGTQLHHNQLVNREQNTIRQAQGEEQNAALLDRSAADVAHTNAETSALLHPQPKPKEENWAEFAGYTDIDGTPLIREQNSGQVVRASDKQHPGGFKVAEPAKAPDEFEKDYRQYLMDNHFPDTALNRLHYRSEWEMSKNAVQVRGQNMTDARSREQNQIARDTKEQQRNAQAENTLAGFNSNMDRLATAANDLLNHPGLEGITGLRGKIPNIPGTDAANAAAKLNTLKSQAAFGVLQDLRNQSKTGGALGQVSDKEEQMLTSNLAALDTAQSTDEFKKSLQNIINFTDGAKQRAREATGRTTGQAVAPSAAPRDFGVAPAGKNEGDTGTLPDGTKIVVKGGRIVAQ